MKSVVVILLSAVVVFAGGMGLLFYQTYHLQEDIKNYKEEIKELKKEDPQEEKMNAYEEIVSKSEGKECTFVRSLIYVEDYDYVGEVPEERFVVFEAMNDHHPRFISLYDNHYQFKKEESYLITFKGIYKEDKALSQYSVVDIKEDKTNGNWDMNLTCE